MHVQARVAPPAWNAPWAREIASTLAPTIRCSTYSFLRCPIDHEPRLASAREKLAVLPTRPAAANSRAKSQGTDQTKAESAGATVGVVSTDEEA